MLVNAQLRTTFGYDDDELLGQPIILLPMPFAAIIRRTASNISRRKCVAWAWERSCSP